MHGTPTAPVWTPRVSAGCTLHAQPKSTSSGGKAANRRQPRGNWDAEAARPQGRPGGPAHSRCLGRLGTGEGLWSNPGRAPTTPRGARRLLGPLSCSQEPPSGRGWASVMRGRKVSWWRIDVSREGESSLPFLLPGGVQLPPASRLPGALTHPEFWSIWCQAMAGRGLMRPGSPRVFLHSSGSTGTSLLPDAAHCKRRGKAGFPGQVLILDDLFIESHQPGVLDSGLTGHWRRPWACVCRPFHGGRWCVPPVTSAGAETP